MYRIYRKNPYPFEGDFVFCSKKEFDQFYGSFP